jgi:hypothetical protein
MKFTKTTVEIPDAIIRRAKSKAAKQGISLRQLITEAIEEKLKNSPATDEKPWMNHIGKLKHPHKETAQIDPAIEGAFEQIELEMWS